VGLPGREFPAAVARVAAPCRDDASQAAVGRIGWSAGPRRMRSLGAGSLRWCRSRLVARPRTALRRTCGAASSTAGRARWNCRSCPAGGGDALALVHPAGLTSHPWARATSSAARCRWGKDSLPHNLLRLGGGGVSIAYPTTCSGFRRPDRGLDHEAFTLVRTREPPFWRGARA
jgi:hypothetical protein